MTGQSHGHEGLKNIGEGNGEGWKFQVRVNLARDFADAARDEGRMQADPALKPLRDLLNRHGMALTNQYDAFANFCKEAEEHDRLNNTDSETGSTLYKWTKETIEKPGKKEAYATRFTFYTKDGAQIYDEALADAIVADLQPLKDSGVVTQINKISSDPARNPQAPARFNRG